MTDNLYLYAQPRLRELLERAEIAAVSKTMSRSEFGEIIDEFNKAIQQWISVADELPDAEQTVMIARLDWDGDPVGMGWLDGDTWRDIAATPLPGKLAPTHWMPLPEPPIAESEAAK